jgi:hypothetical protein
MPSMGGIGSYTKKKLPQTRNKRTRMIRLCDTCRQSWSFYDLTVGFVQDVQRQKCRVLRGVCTSCRWRCLSSSEVLHFALTTISSSRSLDLFREEGLQRVRLCLKLTTPSVNHFYLIFVIFFFACFRGEFEASMFGVLDSCD